jgi:hypothetical protein
MYGYLVGGLAVAWGVMAAFLDQPGSSPSARTRQLCTVLLVAAAGTAVTGGVASLMF